MSERERRLDIALYELAAAGRQGAPDRVEAALVAAFRRHKRARRVRRFIASAMPAAAAAALAFYAWTPKPVGRPAEIALHPGVPAMAWAKTAPPRVVPRHKPTAKPATDKLAATPFIALPYGGDPAAGQGEIVVRVEMPRSAMRLVGMAVSEERERERVQADVVLGTDGLARAVRFIDE